MSLEGGNDFEQINEIINILLGNKALKEIEEMELPFDNWVTIMKAAIAVATNKDFDDVEAEFREESESE